jgi:serpin B
VPNRRLVAMLCAVVAALPLACASPVSPPVRSPSTPGASAASIAPTSAPTPTASATVPAAGTIQEVRADAPRTVPGETAVAEATDVVAADRAFAMRLYLAARDGNGNLFLSPYSVSTALSMVYAGAHGKTADELAAALGVDVPDVWHAGRNAIDTSLRDVPTVDPSEHWVPLTIEPTNAMFGQGGFEWKREFLDVLARNYGAGVQALDFAGNPDASRDAINDWVRGKTHDRIPKLLPPDAVSSLTRFVLVNAIFFKATWADPFKESATKQEPFHRLDGSTVKAPLMHGDIDGQYTKGTGWQAVTIQYVNAQMTVILPDAGKFAAVENGLDASFLESLDERSQFAAVKLTLPKWKSDSRFDLIPVLRKLGINALFDDADLSAMAAEPLGVSAVVHQANVSVDEAGTEAAAATAVVGDTTGGGPDISATVRVDRPFIYVIRSSISGEVLFVGRVMDPTAG